MGECRGELAAILRTPIISTLKDYFVGFNCEGKGQLEK